MQNLRVVVTGASGFLGKHVTHKLSEYENIEVIPVSRQPLEGWCHVLNYSDTPAGDVLIHLAEQNDRSQVAQAGESYVETSLLTLHALLGKGFRRVVYASSGVLYGDRHLLPCTPDDGVLIEDIYTNLKFQSELEVLKMPGGKVARLSNVYGVGMSTKNVMSTILHQLSKDGPLQVMDTTPVRDFLWAEDAAEGLISLALHESGPINDARLYNLGTGIGTSIETLALMALDISGQSHRVVQSMKESESRSSLILDASVTTLACGWRPKTSLHSGLKQILKN